MFGHFTTLSMKGLNEKKLYSRKSPRVSMSSREFMRSQGKRESFNAWGINAYNIPANIYLFKVKYRNTKKDLKYVQR